MVGDGGLVVFDDEVDDGGGDGGFSDLLEVGQVEERFVDFVGHARVALLGLEQQLVDDVLALQALHHFRSRREVLLHLRGLHRHVEQLQTQVEHFDPENKFILKDLLSGTIFERSSNNLPIVLDPGESHIFVIEQKWGV